jgi:hypothetical protein
VAFRILTTHQQHRKVLYRQVEELEGARHWLQSQRASWLGLGLTRAPPPSPYPYWLNTVTYSERKKCLHCISTEKLCG